MANVLKGWQINTRELDGIMYDLTRTLGWLFKVCYKLLSHYGLAIILFTILTKIILLPVSIWVHKNGIKVVRIQPEINHLKAKFFGDGDHIAEETAALYKREKYNPFASIIPLFIQLALLVGLVGVIYTPFSNILSLPQADINQLVATTVEATGADPEASSIQLTAIEAVQSGQYQEEFSGIPENALNSVQSVNLSCLGLNLAATPAQVGGALLIMPLLAGLAALLLSLIQNKLNPLQAEQSTTSKFGTTAFSVGLSLFLGAFVPAGVGFYWIWSNLFTIVQQYLLNWMIDPKKAIDYDALERSKLEISGLQNIGGKKKLFAHDPNAKREKADYKRFFSIANKHLVFYSEKSGFYKYYKNVIEYLLDHSNVIIHYITSDPDDAIFEKAKVQVKIKPYYIGEKKLITLMMKMDADMVVMTMPDLGNYHIKRSYVRNDIEYVYVYHGITNSHMVARKGCFDNYDTILCVGPHQITEIRETEERYQLSAKKLISCGYPLIDKSTSQYVNSEFKTQQRIVLLAPSWQPDNILDYCLHEIITQIVSKEYTVIIRPHPEYIKRFPSKWEEIKRQYSHGFEGGLQVEEDFSSSVFDADLLITDWSTVAYEYSFTTLKPTLFINTPPKVLNQEYLDYKFKPVDLTWRSVIGQEVNCTDLDNLSDIVIDMLNNKAYYNDKICALRNEALFNFGESAQVGGRYILNVLSKVR